MDDDTKANKDTEADNDELWMDEEFCRLYPLSAQRLRELAEQQQADLTYRQYLETLRGLHAAPGKPSDEEFLALEFSPKEFQIQGGSAWADDQNDGQGCW